MLQLPWDSWGEESRKWIGKASMSSSGSYVEPEEGSQAVTLRMWRTRWLPRNQGAEQGSYTEIANGDNACAKGLEVRNSEWERWSPGTLEATSKVWWSAFGKSQSHGAVTVTAVKQELSWFFSLWGRNQQLGRWQEKKEKTEVDPISQKHTCPPAGLPICYRSKMREETSLK